MNSSYKTPFTILKEICLMKKLFKSALMVSIICLTPLVAQANQGYKSTSGYNSYESYDAQDAVDGRTGERTGFFESVKNIFTFDNDDTVDTRMSQPGRLTVAQTKDLQRSLSTLGHYDGRIDGIWGPQTTAAVREYQESVNSPPNGILTSADLRRLDVYTGPNSDANSYSDISPAAGEYNYNSSTTTTYTYKTDIVTHGNSGTARGKRAWLE